MRRLTGSGRGNLQRHLKKLRSEGLVVTRDYRNSVRYYENHGRYDAGWKSHAALHNENSRRLHDWLLARPGATQIQVLTAAKEWGITRGTAQRNLQSLKAASLLHAKRDGHFVCYNAKKPIGG